MSLFSIYECVSASESGEEREREIGKTAHIKKSVAMTVDVISKCIMSPPIFFFSSSADRTINQSHTTNNKNCLN